MSTIEYHGVETRTALKERETTGASAQNVYSVQPKSGTAAGTESFKFSPVQKASRNAVAHRRRDRTKRRLRGFLVELPDGTPEARVAFIENGETIVYDLPANPIRKAGITMPNQPFEMNEIETEGEDGSFTVSYRYKALAMPADAYIQQLKFDDERKRKRALILKEFGQSQD